MCKRALSVLVSSIWLVLSPMAVAQTAGGGSMEKFVAGLSDPVPFSRLAAAKNLAQCGKGCAGALGVVREKFSNPNEDAVVRVALARAIINLAPEDAATVTIQFLMSVVDSGLRGGANIHATELAIEALGDAEGRAKQALPLIEAASKHRAGSTRAKALRSQQRINTAR